MKKFLTILLLLLGFTVKAQEDITLFRLLNKQGLQQNLNIVLHHNLIDNTPHSNTPVPKDFKFDTGYLQSLIIKPIEQNDGNVLICSLKKKEYYLKYDISAKTLVFALLDKNNLSNYTWNINYAGPKEPPYLNQDVVYITPKKNSNLSIVNDSGVFRLSTITDKNGNPINNQNAKLADKFIFYLQTMNNAL